MAFMTPDEFKRKQEEVKQMDLAKKWIDTFQKMDMSRQQSGFGSMNINQKTDPMDKIMLMMEKRQEMEMTADMMKNIFSADKPDTKKQNTIMESLSNLISTNPGQAKEFLDGLDEDTISKISLLSNPDPNAQVLRSMLTKSKSGGGDMNNMLEVFTKLLALQKEQTPKTDSNQQIMTMMISKMLDQSMDKSQSNESQLMIEMLRQQSETARDQARISEDRAREEGNKFNQLMITVMNDKVQDSRNAPGLIEQITHLGESMGVLKNLGFGGETRSLEELKLSHEQEKWRLDQQMARGQQDMWRGIAEQGMDRLADIMSAPAMQEFGRAAGTKVSDSIANMNQPQQTQNPQAVPTRAESQVLEPNVTEPLHPVELVTFGQINDQEIPIVPAVSHVFGETEKKQ